MISPEKKYDDDLRKMSSEKKIFSPEKKMFTPEKKELDVSFLNIRALIYSKKV